MTTYHQVPRVTSDGQPPIDLSYPVEPWTADALCAQTDPEVFFPERGASPRDAKAVCAACPVRLKCLEWAIEHSEAHGVWGGLTDTERRRLRRTLPHPCPNEGCGASYATAIALRSHQHRWCAYREEVSA